MTARTPAAQAARDRQARNLGEEEGQAAPERTGSYQAASEAAIAQRQPLVDQSAQVESFKAALRMQETGSYEGAYEAQGKWDSDQQDKPVGAYGIMSKNWKDYAQASGIPNANWRDSRAQDRAAGNMVDNLANRYGGNWGIVAVAWYAGAEAAQRVMRDHGVEASTQQIRSTLGDNIGDYAQQLVGHGAKLAESEFGVANGLGNLQGDVGFLSSPMRSGGAIHTAQDAVRSRLVALAGKGQGGSMSPSDIDKSREELADEPYRYAKESQGRGGRRAWPDWATNALTDEELVEYEKLDDMPSENRINERRERYEELREKLEEARPPRPQSRRKSYEDMTYEERGDYIVELENRIEENS